MTKPERERARGQAAAQAGRDLAETCRIAGAAVRNYEALQEEFAKEAHSRRKPKTSEPAPGAVEIEQARLANYKAIRGER